MGAEPTGFQQAPHNQADRLRQGAVEADTQPASCRHREAAALHLHGPGAEVEAALDQGHHPAATAASADGQAAATACCWTPGAEEVAPASCLEAARPQTAMVAAGSCWAEFEAST